MEPYEVFGIAAFRSRQQVIKFDEVLKKKRIKSTIISTPKEVAIGCGLSIRFDVHDMDKAVYEYKWAKPSALIGFYKVERRGIQTIINPVHI